MPRVRAAVLLLAWMALALGGVARGTVGEQGWSHLQQYWGQVQSIKSTSVANDQGYAKARSC